MEIEQPADTPPPWAAAAGANAALLDNTSPAETGRAGSLALGSEILPTPEASGGISFEAVADYAATGVNVVLVDPLTHPAGTRALVPARHGRLTGPA